MTEPISDCPAGTEDAMLKIGVKPFLAAFGILLLLIVFSGLLTLWIPAGTYQRVETDGRMAVVADSFQYLEEVSYPAWRWFTAPVEVIWGDNWLMILVLSLFMIFLGGSFTVLEKGGVLQELLDRPVCWRVPEIRVSEIEQVLPLDRVVNELHELTKLQHALPLLVGQ